MLDVLNSLPNLARVDVVITGDWVMSPAEPRVWSGEAVAEMPIVGIIFLRRGNRMYWAKSGTPYIRIRQGIETQPVSNQLVVELRLHGTLHVQFMYSLGLQDMIYQAAAVLNSADYRPSIPLKRTVQTGQIFAFASCESAPPVSLYAMFLARQDVKMRRKHIWRLRKPLLASLTPPLLEVFSFGRTGEFAV